MLSVRQDCESKKAETTSVSANFNHLKLVILCEPLTTKWFTAERCVNSIWKLTTELVPETQVLRNYIAVLDGLKKKSDIRDVSEDFEQSKSCATDKFSELPEKLLWEEDQPVHID